MITIINYGMGNLNSIKNMLKKIGEDSVITSDIDEINKATKIILPGVGAFDSAISKINELNIRNVLDYKVLIEHIPILGICLGMQLMTNKSEEGLLEGFKWVDATTLKFDFSDKNIKLKVPHMGWNKVQIMNDNGIFKDMNSAQIKFYFVHSYYIKCNNLQDIATLSNYGNDFVSSFNVKNIYGTQFHPEKSHKYGMKVLSNFVNI